MTIYVWARVLAFVTLFAPSALAERYLTPAEAQRVIFPEATRFDDETVRFTPQSSSAVSKLSGTKVMNRGHRIWWAYKGDELLGVVVMDHVLGKHEIIDYAVGIGDQGKVQQVEILEYRESHGYEIRSPKWREQFRGKTAKAPLKLNSDIYNISGATMSCRNVTEGVKRVLAMYEVVLRPRVSSAQ